MTAKKILVLYLVMILVCLGMVYATDTAIGLNAVKQNIFPTEEAKFNLEIDNMENKELRFSIQADNVEWSLLTEPQKDASNFIVASGKTAITDVKLSPIDKDLKAGFYTVGINIKNLETNDVTNQNVIINVLDYEKASGMYEPSIKTEVSFDKEVDPRQILKIEVKLKNLNPRELKNVDVFLESEHFSEKKSVSLSPVKKDGDEQILEFEFELDEKTAPGKDFLKVKTSAITDDGAYNFSLEPIEYSIRDYGDIEGEGKTSSFFFKRGERTEYENSGNVRMNKTIKIEYTGFQGLFISTEPKGEKIEEDGKRFIKIDLELDKGETKEVVVVYNYRIIFYVLVIVFVALVYYIKSKSPIALKKSAKIIGKKEGGISELKVLIHIKNMTEEPIKEINITDKVPHLVELVQHFDVGVLHPDKVLHHKKKGTIIKWSLDELDPGEERVMTYHIKTKLSILGGLTLPYADAKFDTKAGRKSINSNRVIIGVK